MEDEESFALLPHLPDRRCPVGKHIRAVLKNVFVDAQKALFKELDRTTLVDILAQLGSARSLRSDGNPAEKPNLDLPDK